MSKKALINRLSWYYPMERMHAFLTFPLILIYLTFTNPFSDIIFVCYGLAICIFILFQGQHYWKLKLYSLKGKRFNQEKNLAFFRMSKKLNLLMILLIPVMLVIQLYLNHWTIKLDRLMVWGVLANAFGVLEHINYYNRQLMIDNTSDFNFVIKNKKLKTASLAKDLLENEI